ncbi:translation initiation factor eIF2B subunit delta-like [Silene latifolia]|uniref:translation initiation factor eIF2B subunit delta-like n=1 Tax=Silene latifolia TaxID=37657 RepID=UPI003D78365D
MMITPPTPGARLGGDSVAPTESGDDEFSDDWTRKSSSGMYSLGFEMSGIGSSVNVDDGCDDEVDFASLRSEKEDNTSKAKVSGNDVKQTAKSLKEKSSKAERRALQEAQRAAKAAKKANTSVEAAEVTNKVAKVNKLALQKKNATFVASSVGVSEMRGGERPSEKENKKGNPTPRMQYDDKSRVDKTKKRSLVKHTEAKNRVDLFGHLPQYEYKNELSDLESKFFELDQVHPAVFKVGLQHLSGNVTGSNARCIAMLYAFREAIEDYHTPPQKFLIRDLTAKISSYISYLNECRPLSISMGNAIRCLKTHIAKLPISVTEWEAKSYLCSEIDNYITEKIIIANKVIVNHAATKIRDGDVLLTYGCSSVVEMVLIYAHELGKKFRVIIIDSRPKLEGQGLLRRLVTKGLRCTYTHINGASYIMHEVTRVFLGAAAIFSNGTVYSRIGTACVAMIAHSFRVPVLVCCEAYKFHERVQLDSICANELGDPDAISKVRGRRGVNYLDNWTSKENLQLLNLLYDVTPSDYISMIITDYGMVPPSSVPVIVREYRKEHLF